jgi:hypothetical protein
MRRTTLAPDPAARLRSLPDHESPPVGLDPIEVSFYQKKASSIMHRKNRFLLLPIPALIAAVVVATGVIGQTSAVGQPYPARPVDQDLTFSGPAAGNLTATECHLIKHANDIGVSFSGLVGGQPMEVTIYTTSKHEDAGDITGWVVFAHFNHDQYAWATGRDPGKLTINGDQKSGTVDTDLVGPSRGEHVTGSWSCDEVAVF